MTRTYLVTGTDTGVGKTAFCVGLLSALADAGNTVAALKPAETGCVPHGPADALRLRKAASLDLPLEIICPNQFDLPLAPAVAARRARRAFSMPAVLAAHERILAADPDVLIIEGAGGWLVPYADNITTCDLARALSATLVVVARNGLGTINHTSLTVDHIQRQHLPLKGVILNHTDDEADPSEVDNAEAIENLAKVTVLATLPYVHPATTENLRRIVKQNLPLAGW